MFSVRKKSRSFITKRALLSSSSSLFLSPFRRWLEKTISEFRGNRYVLVWTSPTYYFIVAGWFMIWNKALSPPPMKVLKKKKQGSVIWCNPRFDPCSWNVELSCIRSFILSVPSSFESTWQVQLNLGPSDQITESLDWSIHGSPIFHFRKPILIRNEQPDDVMGTNLHQLCCADQLACCVLLSFFWRTGW